MMSVIDSSAPRPTTPLPIVVIGAGGIVRSAHLPANIKTNFPVFALMDPIPGKAAELARQFEVNRSFESLSDCINSAPRNAVFDVAVPAPQIIGIISQLPDGAAVLLQKPMGESLTEARAIRDLCRSKGLTAAVNFQLRFVPAVLRARALQDQGTLGTLHDMEVQIRTMMPWENWPFLAAAPRLEVLYHSIHYIDLVRSWFGNPIAVYGKTVRNPGTPSLQTTKSIIVMDYGEWRRAFIATNHNYRFGEEMERLCSVGRDSRGNEGDTGRVILDYPKGKPDRLQYSRNTGTK